MLPDRYKRRPRKREAAHQSRLRHQIATEAARRLVERLHLAKSVAPPDSTDLDLPEASVARTSSLGSDRDQDEPTAPEPPDSGEGLTDSEIPDSEIYAAKREAAAILGITVWPGDLPSDHQVLARVDELIRTGQARSLCQETGEHRSSLSSVTTVPSASAWVPIHRMSDHLDRFAIYRMRLNLLEGVKLHPRYHPEGDALFHSLQVFELARQARPFDEELLTAALLHEVGRAIDPASATRATLEALDGTITPRTSWLIRSLSAARAYREGAISRPKDRKHLESEESFEDLVLLEQLDQRGRRPGAEVDTLEGALAYIKALEEEGYLPDEDRETEPNPGDDGDLSAYSNFSQTHRARADHPGSPSVA